MRIADNALPNAAGEFSWQTEGAPVRYLAMMLPCGHVANLPLNVDRGWRWDGSEDAPTLTPSILCCPGSCDWHGYMTGGELRAV